MKTAYSTYCSEARKAFKMLSPHSQTEADFCRFGVKVWPATGYCCGEYVNLHAEFLWRFRKIKHFFLSPGVADFCVSSVKELSTDYCKLLPDCGFVEAPCEPDSIPISARFFRENMGNVVHGGYAIHVPAKEQHRSLIVIPNMITPLVRANKISHLELHYFSCTDGLYFTFEQPDKKLIETCSPPINNDTTEECSRHCNWMNKLVYGLSLYMDAFPDAVVDAGAESVHHIKHYDGSRHIVNRNAIVDEEHTHSVSPHWRRGHFKLLSSEKFTRKRGQTVYVRGTFVKGQAFDVLDDAPAIKSVTAQV